MFTRFEMSFQLSWKLHLQLSKQIERQTCRHSAIACWYCLYIEHVCQHFRLISVKIRTVKQCWLVDSVQHFFSVNTFSKIINLWIIILVYYRNNQSSISVKLFISSPQATCVGTYMKNTYKKTLKGARS